MIVNHQGYYRMLEMSRSVHDILYQGNICMRRRDTDIQLVGTDTQDHAAKGNQCKLANRRKVTLCCWLWEVISKMLQQCTAQWRKSTKVFWQSFSVCVCAKGAACVYLCVYAHGRLSMFVSAQGTKEQNKPEVAWQHKTLPKVNFEDAGTAGGGEEESKKERERKWKAEKRCCDCNALLMIFGKSLCHKQIYNTKHTLNRFIYCVCVCVQYLC